MDNTNPTNPTPGHHQTHHATTHPHTHNTILIRCSCGQAWTQPNPDPTDNWDDWDLNLTRTPTG